MGSSVDSKPIKIKSGTTMVLTSTTAFPSSVQNGAVLTSKKVWGKNTRTPS